MTSPKIHFLYLPNNQIWHEQTDLKDIKSTAVETTLSKANSCQFIAACASSAEGGGKMLQTECNKIFFSLEDN